MRTRHRLLSGDACRLAGIPSESVDLVVTSPPYPMIEMWDALFGARRQSIAQALAAGEGEQAFLLMHEELDVAWEQVHRVLKPGSWACVNVGDAARNIGDRFRLFSNHSRILTRLMALGFDLQPLILWRKQTNAPNKFMGSGMLPAGAYVTLEHEYILLARKGGKREFADAASRRQRQESAYFWEERNRWFSDLWEFKGARQALSSPELRRRSAAFPFELPYRLICMYSVAGEVVLDPFLGTGTTTAAAMAAGRSSIGVEIDPAMTEAAVKSLLGAREELNDCTLGRLRDHREWVAKRGEEGALKYVNGPHGFPVMTSQETNLRLWLIEQIQRSGEQELEVSYRPVGEITAEEDAR